MNTKVIASVGAGLVVVAGTVGAYFKWFKKAAPAVISAVV